MSLIGVSYWLFVDLWWIWILIPIAVLIFANVMMQRCSEKNKDRRTMPEEAVAMRLGHASIDYKPEPNIIFKHRAKAIIFLFFCYWFFGTFKPEWLPEVADENRRDFKVSLYVTPVGIFNEKGRILAEKYNCAFWEGQRQALRIRRLQYDSLMAVRYDLWRDAQRFFDQTQKYIDTEYRVYDCETKRLE